MKMNPVVHFEMPGEDKERMKKFYAQAFGWTYNQLGKDFGDYTIVMTSESTPDGPVEKGRINGGFFQKTENNAHPSVVIGVDDIREAMQKVKEAGGKVLGGMGGTPGEPDDIPGVGLYCAFIDTEGNMVSMLQPNKGM